MINVIIIGGGRVGLHLIDTLRKRHNYSITLIENHKSIYDIVDKKYDDVKIIKGDATDRKILIKAGIETADILVIATSIDEVNLLVGIIAQDYNLNKIIARTTNPSHMKMFKKLGLNEVVSPELAACSDIEKKIIPQNISEIAVTGKGDYELMDVTVKSSKVIGKRIGDISPSNDFIVVMCHKDDKFLIAENNIVLEKEDVVSVLVRTKAIKKTKKYFTKSGILPI
ncbi:MAG: TrkA family potassium uptake protein [Methanosphaera sp.]|nr:TrkA family potassium uptake protein [Methanosphaera sp.]